MKPQTPSLTEGALRRQLKERSVLTPLVEQALAQAKRSHGTQKRDDGAPYLEEHIYPVVGELLELYPAQPMPEELIVGALLHDVLEDDPNFTEERCRKEFSDKILEIIKPLTKGKDDSSRALSQEEIFALNRKHVAVIERAPESSKLIKLADRYNNLSSLPAIAGTPKAQRYLRETKELFLPFAEKTSNFFYQKLRNKLEELKHMNA